MGEKFHEPTIRRALIEAEGNITHAAARCGIRRHRLALFIDTRPTLQSLLFDIQEENSDEAESDLALAILNGDAKAVKFYLRTVGRERGYGKPMQPHEKAYIPTMPQLRFDEPDLQPHHEAILDRCLSEATNGNPPKQPAYFDRLDDRLDDLKATLARNLGNPSRTARQFNVTRTELMEYMQTADVLQIVLLESRDEILDEAESQLRIAIREHKPWARQLQLELRSQGRGYSKHPQPMKPFWRDEPPAHLDWDVSKFSPELQRDVSRMQEELGSASYDANPDDALINPANFGGAAAVLAQPLEALPDASTPAPAPSSLEPLFPPGMDNVASRKMGDELRKRASVPSPDMERILARFRPPAEARLIVRNWDQLSPGARATFGYLIFDHIESERRPWAALEKRPEPRPPTQAAADAGIVAEG